MEWTNQPLGGTALSDQDHPASAAWVRVATLATADPARGVAVRFPEPCSPEPVPARSTITVAAGDVGRAVVVLLEDGDAGRPIIVGVLQERPVRLSRDVTVDGSRISLEAAVELTLKSGKASITLSGDGRIVIEGMEIVSRARGTHKVKGATVLIN